ncbi:Superfamily II DNA or RNA helicase [Glycomyces sambucus]|uniref:Superfamily II DNA or RNA helicase n=1 Tax=Glycomyces sambucus TaxID=380244 RepID=A0A1G9KGT7_9ACTN|nr:DEAD/DEAH box helicase [Glycomyces sambucus]SDL48593.1 Superfamily II DNA or RNA helicase [Glycomyces sambucus]
MIPAAPPESLPSLRVWQRKAMVAYHRGQQRDFMAVATPGAGKTTFALRIAYDLLADGTVDTVTVVCPTEHLKVQWSGAAARFGIQLDPAFRNSDVHSAADYHGVVLTYAQIGADPAVHKRRTLARRTLVILDEIHHAGDARSWGDGVKTAFEEAERRLALTGTPFRSDDNPIPFVEYEVYDDGAKRSKADAIYGYRDALADGVVRPVMFMAYSGQAKWRSSAGDELAVRLGEPLTKDLTSQAWRTALDPAGEWISQVIRAADRRLVSLRAAGIPDAGGLIIASDQNSARAYAGILKRVTGKSATIVLSDDAGSSEKIAKFAVSDEEWLVAVRMVSEGVDIPRLAVGVYATNAHTPLYFAQAIGRFVRSRRTGETASVFLPSVIPLLSLAENLEQDRDHVIKPKSAEDQDPELLLEQAQRVLNEGTELGGQRETLESSAELDQVIFDGGSFGLPVQAGSHEEQEYLGLPGLLTPEQIHLLLQKRQREQMSKQGGARTEVAERQAAEPPMTNAQRRLKLRKQLNALVGARSFSTNEPHGKIHAMLRSKCGGPPSAQATIEQLEERIAAIRSW